MACLRAETGAARSMSASPSFPLHRIELPGDRVVTCGEYGTPDGAPMFCFHGFPSSQSEVEIIHEAGCKLGVRILAPDRPGMGGSTFVAGRRLLDWPRDVAAVADALGVARFLLLAVSGGCPYGLACAHEIPERLGGMGIVCGLGPVDRPEVRALMRWPARVSFGAARGWPLLLDALYGGPLGWLLARRPEFVVLFLLVACPEEDKVVLRERVVRRALRRAALGALRSGTQGVRHELRTYVRPWGFSLAAIKTRIHLWHGAKDATVPLAHGELLGRELPHAELTIAPGEGHFSLPVRHAESILRTLLAESTL